MRIRSITCFYHPCQPQSNKVLERLVNLAQTASLRFEEKGFEVQTKRLATVPFPYLLEEITVEKAVALAVSMQNQALAAGFTFLSLGPALPEFPESYAVIPSMLAATGSVFCGAKMATPEEGVILPAVQACGKIIAQAATISPDGFGNLRFAALANMPPFAPFFPAAHAAGEQPAFALAIESADVALAVFKQAKTLAAGRKRLLQTLEEQGKTLADISNELARIFDVEFKGIDFSLAPHPDAWCSIGAALEKLGPTQIGMYGSLAAAAFLADTLDEGKWQRAGFNGLMLPVLEDATLAERSAHGVLSLKDLLLYSAVCGTGLDTVPLPGDATPQQLSAVLLDVAALSSRLGKPLTARLMPVPGKAAGELTEFNFDYFSNGGIMDLPASPLRGALAGSESFKLKTRSAHGLA